MINKTLSTAAKAAITVGIIWLVLKKVELAPVAARLMRLGPAQIVIAVLPFATQILLASERWRAICNRLGVTLRFASALQIVTIGTFFNQTLPSAVGGDAVRVWLLVRERIAFGKSLSTVLCDRALALVVLIGLSVATLPLFYQNVSDPHARYLVTALSIVGLAGFAVFLVAGDWLGHVFRRWTLTRPFGDLAHDFHRLFTASAVTTGLVICSLVIHVLTIVGAWIIATLLGIQVNLIDCLVVMPSVILITMLPVSIAGWGLREGAMVVGFGLVGVTASDALAISICLGLANIIIGLPGGLLWLVSRQSAAPEIASVQD